MVTRETIFYNDKAYTVSLIRKDGVTYLKTRDIAEILGLAVGKQERHRSWQTSSLGRQGRPISRNQDFDIETEE